MDKYKDKPDISNKSHLSYDKSYKLFFSHPEMVRSLLQNFIQADFVRDLDFSSLRKLNGSYIAAKDGKSRYRDNDMVWQVNLNHHKSRCYVVLMLEFQRTSNHWMALRILNYTSLILQDLVRSRKLSSEDTLPLIFPIVIYNGEETWTAPVAVEKLFGEIPHELIPYCPAQSYFLVDEKHGSYRKDQLDLSLMGNLISINRIEDLNEFSAVLKNLNNNIQYHNNEELQELFNYYIFDNIKSVYGSKLKLNLRELGDLEMINERLLKNRDNLIRQGKAEGITETQIKSLKTILKFKFTDLPGSLDGILAKLLAKGDFSNLIEKAMKADSLQDFMKGMPGV